MQMFLIMTTCTLHCAQIIKLLELEPNYISNILYLISLLTRKTCAWPHKGKLCLNGNSDHDSAMMPCTCRLPLWVFFFFLFSAFPTFKGAGRLCYFLLIHTQKPLAHARRRRAKFYTRTRFKMALVCLPH